MLAGHGEYWTRTMRDTAELARDSGVNIASMGANTGYWQVRYEDGEHTVVGYKNGAADPVADPGNKTILFRDLGRPECELFGVQYDDSWSVDSTVRNYGVVAGAAGNPWLQGTGLTAGATTTGGTVGYEWDLITPGCNHPPVTPLLHWDDGSGGFPPADAVTYTAPSGARVFSAGSNQFAWGLDGWRDGYTQTADTRLMAFMRNMITDLTAGEPPPPPPNEAPQASFSITPGAPLVSQSVTFADTSSDVDGTIAARAWDLNDDGQFDDGTGTTATRTFAAAGTYTVRLRVTDDDGAPAVATRQIVITAVAPPVEPPTTPPTTPTTPVTPIAPAPPLEPRPLPAGSAPPAMMGPGGVAASGPGAACSRYATLLAANAKRVRAGRARVRAATTRRAHNAAARTLTVNLRRGAVLRAQRAKACAVR